MFDYLKKTLIASALICVSAGLMSTTVHAADPYAPYKGKTLVVNFPAHPHYDAAMKVLPKFTEETGIKVEVDQLQYLAMRQKQTLELTKPVYDQVLLGNASFEQAVSAGDAQLKGELSQLQRFLNYFETAGGSAIALTVH